MAEKTEAEMTRCLCWHPRWLHEGIFESCTMAGCHCHVFIPKQEEKE